MGPVANPIFREIEFRLLSGDATISCQRDSCYSIDVLALTNRGFGEPISTTLRLVVQPRYGI